MAFRADLNLLMRVAPAANRLQRKKGCPLSRFAAL
jgi:hypothetical protein